MITPLTIYMIGICDNLITICIFITCLLGCTIFVAFICYAAMLDDNDKEGDKRRMTVIKRLIISFILCCILYPFIPSTKLAASMIVIPAIANNEKILSIGSNSLEALYKLSEKWLLELKEDDEKSSKNL